MWTVFIADDEPKIRRRLRRLVESFSDNFQVCGEAEDGVTALEIIGEELPDILLVDICMPRLNGLDFIEQISSETQNSIIIVVSGHDEFEYAQRAVQLPIFEYVLKPVEAGFLEEVFTRAVAVLQKRRDKNELLQWAENKVTHNRGELVQELFSDWIEGTSNPRDVVERFRVMSPEFPSTVRLLGIQLNAICYGVTVLEIREHHVLKLAVKKMVEETLGFPEQWLHFEDRRDHLLYLFNGDYSSIESDKLKKEIRSQLNLPVRCMVSDCRMDYDDFIRDYEDLCIAVDKSGHDDPLIGRIYKYLEDHYQDKELNLESMASDLSLSPGYVSRLLKQHTGANFSEYTNRFRIIQAIRLFNDDDKLLYEIAEDVGYSSQHYFSRIFKRITGLTPADYRNGQG